MSAFFVSPENINSIAWFLYQNGAHHHTLAPWARTEEVITLCGGSRNLYWPLDLAAAMRDLNTAAMVQRYGAKELISAVECYADADAAPARALSPLEAYKLLSCWLYQCEEGNVPDHPLWKALNALEEAGRKVIDVNSPEYEAAPWQ